MRTQLRRQAAAHTDHVQDVLKVQEQELRADAEQVFEHTKVKSEHTIHKCIMCRVVYLNKSIL